MRRIVPVLLCTVAVMMAAGAWIAELPQDAMHTPTGSKAPEANPYGAILKPRTEASSPEVLIQSAPRGEAQAVGLAPLRMTSEEPVKGTPLFPIADAEDTLLYDNDFLYGRGFTPSPYYCATRFTTARKCTLRAAIFAVGQATNGLVDDTVYILAGNTPTQPGAVLCQEPWPFVNEWDWYRVDLSTPQEFDAGEDFWVVVKYTSDASTVGTDDGPNIANRHFITNMTTYWEVSAQGWDWNWCIRAAVEYIPEAEDMATLSIDGLPDFAVTDRWVELKATVQNTGSNTQAAGVPVKLEITGPSAYSYTDDDQVTLTELEYGETEQITFSPDWRTPTVEGTYTIKVWTELTGDLVPGNDTFETTIEVSNWMTYADWNGLSYYWRWNQQQGQFYYASEFQVPYPYTIDRLKAFFYHPGVSQPPMWWKDSTYRWVIYDEDFQTALYTSTWLEAGSGTGEYEHTLTTPLSVTGTVLATVEAFTTNGDTSYPYLMLDGDPDDRSITGDPVGGWYYQPNGEYAIAAHADFTAPDHDLGFYDLDAPFMYVEPGDDVVPVGYVRNYGTLAETAAPCSCWVVDTATDARVYSGYATVTVAAGGTAQVTFPTWSVPAGNNYYQVVMATFLPTEENPTNDGIAHVFSALDIVDVLTAPELTEAVTFDGSIDPGEWDDANVYDISNILGEGDDYYYYPPGNVFMYLKYDDDYVYAAFDMPWEDEVDTSEVGLYVDEDNDGVFSGDDSEGNYFFRSYPAPRDTVIYRALQSANLYEVTDFSFVSSYGTGHLQYEMAMPRGTDLTDLNLPGDTFGIWVFFLNMETEKWRGYWHTLMDIDDAFDPAFYGKVYLEPAGPGPSPWPSGWNEVASMPSAPSGRSVKRGGWLAALGDVVYAGKGYKTQDFYKYDPYGDTWTTLGSLPYGDKSGRQREAKKGSRGVGDGGNSIYYTAGNNTLTFSKYFADVDSWVTLQDVPEGPDRKRVKGGNDMVYVTLDDTGYVYLMKGYRTEFYRYNTETGTWQTLPDVPASRGKVKRGSWLAYDGSTIFAHEANYYNRATDEHYMYAFDVATSTWGAEPMKGMPLYGLHGGRVRKKKSKDGGSGDFFHDGLYALKGGNSQQFFKYHIASDTWTELDTVPTNGSSGRKRRVKYGAKLVSFGSSTFFTLKGNKTTEMWRYVIPTAMSGQPERSGVMSGQTGIKVGVTLAPNPIASGLATVRYSLPKAGPARVSVVDVTGRTVSTRSIVATRTGAVSLDLRGLSNGVYLMKLEADGFTTTKKLVVQQ